MLAPFRPLKFVRGIVLPLDNISIAWQPFRNSSLALERRRATLTLDLDRPSMDESGSEYFPTPRKGRRLEAILEESTTSIGQQEQPENCLFFTELRVFTTFLEELSAQRKCTTRDA